MAAPGYGYGQAPGKQFYEAPGQDGAYGAEKAEAGMGYPAPKGASDWQQQGGYDRYAPVVQQPQPQPRQFSAEAGGGPADPYRYPAYATPAQPSPQASYGQKSPYGPPPSGYQQPPQQYAQQQGAAAPEQPAYQPPYAQQATPQGAHQAPPASPQEYPYYGHSGPQKAGPPQQHQQQQHQQPQPSPMQQQQQQPFAYNRPQAHQPPQQPQQQPGQVPPPPAGQVQYPQPGQQPYAPPEYSNIGQAVRDLNSEDETFKGIVKACVTYFSKEYDKMQKNMVTTTANMKSRMKEIDERLVSIAATEAALKKEKETLALERKQVEANVKTYERDVTNMVGEKEKMSALLSDLGGVLMRVEKKTAPPAAPAPQEAPASAPRASKPEFEESGNNAPRPTARGRGDPRGERSYRCDTDDEEEDIPRRAPREGSRASARPERGSPNGTVNGRRATRESSRDARDGSRDGRREPKRDDRKELGRRRPLSSDDEYSSDARDTRHTRDSSRHEDYQETMRKYKPAAERRRAPPRQWKE